jgi:putative transcriptional regulator
VAARALEAEIDTGNAAAAGWSDVPSPLASRLGRSLDDIPWKRLAPGIWHYPIQLSKRASGDLRLIKVAPGQAIPEHGHGGEELTLMLRGSYHDEIGTFQTGDVADLDTDVEHRPVADAVTGCICLIANERKARFKGLLARLMQPFIGV